MGGADTIERTFFTATEGFMRTTSTSFMLHPGIAPVARVRVGGIAALTGLLGH